MRREALLLLLLLHCSLFAVRCGSAEVPSILAWTGIFRQPLHTWFERKLRHERCPLHCTFVPRSQATNVSAYDALLFHSRDLNSRDLPSKRSAAQQYLLFSVEAPGSRGEHTFKTFPPHFFNGTIGYSSRNDYVFDYDKPAPADLKMTPEVMRNKTESILGIISNCKTDSKRERVIDLLRAHVNMTLSGSCYNRRTSAEELAGMMKSHRFGLALENRACAEYVTEKAYRYKQLIVPIVLSRRLVGDLLPAGAFIALDDFGSAAAFAKRIQLLMKDDEEYAKYFAWMSEERRRGIMYKRICRMCEDLHLRRLGGARARTLAKAAFPDDKGTCKPGLAKQLFKK